VTRTGFILIRLQKLGALALKKKKKRALFENTQPPNSAQKKHHAKAGRRRFHRRHHHHHARRVVFIRVVFLFFRDEIERFRPAAAVFPRDEEDDA
jgi:hypothetical protein